MEHEAATLAWLRAEDGQHIVLIERDGEKLRPAHKPNGAMLVRLISTRPVRRAVYDVTTSAGTLPEVAGQTVFFLATAKQVESYEQTASAL